MNSGSNRRLVDANQNHLPQTTQRTRRRTRDRHDPHRQRTDTPLGLQCL